MSAMVSAATPIGERMVTGLSILPVLLRAIAGRGPNGMPSARRAGEKFRLRRTFHSNGRMFASVSSDEPRYVRGMTPKVHWMTADPAHPTRAAAGRRRLTAALLPLLVMLTSGALIALAPGASAAQAPVGLGTAGTFAVLAGSTVTNTGPSVIDGSVGVSPGDAVTGFPPGMVHNGVIHRGDAVARNAKSDLTLAYNSAAGRTPSTVVHGDLGGRTLTPGVYKSASSLGLTGTVTLNAEGNPQAVFIFQIGSTLITASHSRVALIGGADACNVFWQVGSSATLGTGTTFRGTILALTSISATTGATIEGRALARNGAVTLDTNTITLPLCIQPTTPPATTPPTIPPTTTKTYYPPPPPTTTPGTTPPGGGGGAPTSTATVTTGPSGPETGTAAPSATSTATSTATPTSPAGVGPSGGQRQSPRPTPSHGAGTGLARTGAGALIPVTGALAVLLFGGGLMAATRRLRRR
jgi:hypothetical protein